MGEATASAALVSGGIRVGDLGEPARFTTAGFVGAWDLVEDLGYSWVADHLERVDGKEARREHYARLDRATLR